MLKGIDNRLTYNYWPLQHCTCVIPQGAHIVSGFHGQPSGTSFISRLCCIAKLKHHISQPKMRTDRKQTVVLPLHRQSQWHMYEHYRKRPGPCGLLSLSYSYVTNAIGGSRNLNKVCGYQECQMTSTTSLFVPLADN